MRVNLLAREDKFFNLFDYFFVRIRLHDITRVFTARLSKRFDGGFGYWHSMDNVAESEGKVNDLQASVIMEKKKPCKLEVYMAPEYPDLV